MKKRPAIGGFVWATLFTAGFGLLAGTCFGEKKNLPDTSGMNSVFRGAPASASRLKNPYDGQPNAILAGRKLFLRHCAPCHGEHAEGRRNAPPLGSGVFRETPDGVLFWFLKNGNLRAGMPSWAGLPPDQRWQIVSFVKSLQ